MWQPSCSRWAHDHQLVTPNILEKFIHQLIKNKSVIPTNKSMSVFDEYLAPSYFTKITEVDRRDLIGPREFGSDMQHEQHEQHEQLNSTHVWSDYTRSRPESADYVRALIGFAICLILYFCFLCFLCDNEADASKKAVDKSIVKKVRHTERPPNNLMAWLSSIAN